MRMHRDGCPLPVTRAFAAIVEETIAGAGINSDHGIVLNFRDPTYSPGTGGFHPVEVAIDRGGQLTYVTDFTYVGQPMFAELVKEIDFDFGQGIFEHMGRVFPIQDGRGLFALWQANFCAYYRAGVYQVSVEEMA